MLHGLKVLAAESRLLFFRTILFLAKHLEPYNKVVPNKLPSIDQSNKYKKY